MIHKGDINDISLTLFVNFQWFIVSAENFVKLHNEASR